MPKTAQEYRTKWELALDLLRQAREWGQLTADWVTGDDAYGQVGEFRDGVVELGLRYVLEVPGHLPVWPVEPTWVTAPYGGMGRPPTPKPVASERHTVRERAAALPPAAWQELTVAEGAQGPRTFCFAFERVRESRDRQPGEELWLIHRQNLDGTEARFYFSNAPSDTPPATLARVSAARWPIETEFEDEKSLVALDEYEVRGWPGWHHHITMCLLASAFLLTLQQEWGGKDAPNYPAAGVPDHLRTLTQEALDPRRTAAVVGRDASPQ